MKFLTTVVLACILSLNAFGQQVQMGNGRDAQGWTTFTASADTRTIYVSSSTGNDANDGLTPSTPKRTIATGKALLRNTFPDWLLLKRGDTWHENFGQWKTGGRSPQEMMVVGAYGDGERPLLLTGAQDGIYAFANNGTPNRISNIAFVSLSFIADTYDGSQSCQGIEWLLTGTNMLVEDLSVQGYNGGIVVSSTSGDNNDLMSHNLVIRRNEVLDCYALNNVSNSEGMFIWHVEGILIEENVLDHNGWNDNVPGAGATMFNQNVYIQNGCLNATFINNISCRAGSHGLQQRCGGLTQNNLFIGNSLGLMSGGGSFPEHDGVQCIVDRNIITEPKDISPSLPRGCSLEISNITNGSVTNNLIFRNLDAHDPRGIYIHGTAVANDGTPTIGVHNVLLSRNVIYNMPQPFLIEGNATQITGITMRGNDAQDHVGLLQWIHLWNQMNASAAANIQSTNNTFWSDHLPAGDWMYVGTPMNFAQWQAALHDNSSTVVNKGYFDSNATIASYNAFAGGQATLADFYTQIRAQRKGHWNAFYTTAVINRWLRRAFDMQK